MLKITLKRSFIGRDKRHKRVLRALGLRKLNQTVEHKDVPSVKGMIDKVAHMVEVTKPESKGPKAEGRKTKDEKKEIKAEDKKQKAETTKTKKTALRQAQDKERNQKTKEG